MAQDFESQGPLPEIRPGSEPAPTKDAPPHFETAHSRGKKTLFPVIVSVLIAAALASAWVIHKREAEAAPRPAPPLMSADKPTAVATDGPPRSAVPVLGSSDDVKGLKDEVAALSRRLDEIQGKVGVDKETPAASLKPLQAKVDELAKVPEMVKSLPEKLNALDGRVKAIDKGLEDLKREVATLKKGVDTAPAPRPTEAQPKDVDGADQAMSDAVALFKGKKYKEANAAFGKLAQAKANDARVLYYAALSHGFATGNWKEGESVSLVKKGIEREKAGSPESSKIDEVFSDLTKATGKDWLDGYRKQAKP